MRKVNPYAGIIVCGDCGYNFQRVTCRDGYECGTYHKKGNTVCYSHFIKKEVLDSIVKNEIIDIIMDTAQTGESGNSGDGRIFVLPVEESYTISSQSKDD